MLSSKFGSASAFVIGSLDASFSLESFQWLLDSSTTHHLTIDVVNLHTLVPYTGYEIVTLDSGISLTISHLGSSVIIVNYYDLKLHKN